MSTYIVLTSKCYENARANGICGKKIQEALIKQGHRSILVGYTPNKLESELEVKEDCYKFHYAGGKHKSTKIDSIKRIFVPRYNKELVNGYVDICEDIISSNRVDAIVGIYFPIETLIAMDILKKRYGIKTISYQVDSATDVAIYSDIMHRLHTYAYVMKAKSIYKNIDYVIAMTSNRLNMEKRYLSILGNKLLFVDSLALYEKHHPNKRENKKTIDFLYTGTLDKDYYSPKPFIEMFVNNSDRLNWRLHFYSRGNCDDMLKWAADNDDRIVLHGYVDQEMLDDAMKNADFFLSTDHLVKKNCVPYKILNYFSYGKPVIHFTKEAGFTVENYIDKYPLGLTVNQEKILEENRRIREFVDNNIDNSCSVDEIYKLFHKDTAKYSAEIIEKL